MYSNISILFVDDEEKSRKYFSIIFGKTREIMVACDGLEALEILQSEAGKRIGVIVTDQIMPRMTGIEMLTRLGDHNSHIVKVLSTAYTDSELVAGVVESGLIDYFIGKPWAIDKLQETLDRAVAHHEFNKGEQTGGIEITE
jgi:two-component system, sensor histidine kinase and response regulator